MKSNLFIIVKNGWSYLAYAVVAFFIFTFLDIEFLAFLSFLAVVGFIYIFRNPERELPTFEKKSILSPVDGTVTQILTLEESDFAYRVDILTSYRDVSVLRAPITATLKSLEMTHGTRVSQNSKLFTDLNEKCELVFVNDDLNEVKVVHRLTQSFTPLSVDIIKAQNVYQTARYGFMLSGITSIYLPNNVRLNVNVANELKASESLIGYFS